MRRMMLLAGAVSLAAQATAQSSAPATQASLDQMKLDLEFAKLGLEQKKLEKEVLQSKIDALDLGGAEGKTTVLSDAGKLETFMLASRAVEHAAQAIAGAVGTKGEAIQVAVLTAEQRLDFSAAAALPREMQAIRNAAEALRELQCPPLPPPPPPAAGSSSLTTAMPPTAIIGAALSLLKTDVEVSGFSDPSADAALVDAIVGQPGKPTHRSIKWVIPKEAALSDANNQVVKDFDVLMVARETTLSCRDRVAGSARPKGEMASSIALLNAMVGRIDGFIARVSTPREGGSNDLAAAIMASQLISSHTNFRVLRVRAGHAGGTMLKRSNLFTALGAPALGITGGLIVNWRLADPKTGSVEAGGVLVCRTALTNLNAIHDGRAGEPSCDWKMKKPGGGKKGN